MLVPSRTRIAFLALLSFSIVSMPTQLFACGGGTCNAGILAGMQGDWKKMAANFLKDKNALTTPVSSAAAATGLGAVNGALNAMRSGNSFTGIANQLSGAMSGQIIGSLGQMFSQGLGGFDLGGIGGAAQSLISQNQYGPEYPYAQNSGGAFPQSACAVNQPSIEKTSGQKILATPIVGMAIPIAGGTVCPQGQKKISCEEGQWQNRENTGNDDGAKANNDKPKCQPDGRC